MRRVGLVGLFTLPLVFAALPLIAIAGSIRGGGENAVRVELTLPETPGADADVDLLGFSTAEADGVSCEAVEVTAAGM